MKQQRISPCTGSPISPFHVVWLISETTLQLIQLQGPSQCVSSVHITSLPGFIFFFRALPAEEETLQSPQETWGFSEVGACPLAQHRWLPRPFLASLDGLGSGCLGRGGLARGIHDPILSETSLIRPTAPHALLFPVVHQGKSLGEGVPRSSPQGSHRTEWNGICFSGQRPSTGTCKVIQRLRREKRKKIEGEKASNKIS